MRIFLALGLLTLWTGTASANWSCQAVCGVNTTTTTLLRVPLGIRLVSGDASTPLEAYQAALAQCGPRVVDQTDERMLVVYYSDRQIVPATVGNSCIAY